MMRRLRFIGATPLGVEFEGHRKQWREAPGRTRAHGKHSRCGNAKSHLRTETKSRACRKSFAEKRKRCPRLGDRCGFRHDPGLTESSVCAAHARDSAGRSWLRALGW